MYGNATLQNKDPFDGIKAIGLEIKFPHVIKVNIHCIFVTVTVSVIVPFQINIKSFFWTFVCLTKKKQAPCTQISALSRISGTPWAPLELPKANII